MAALSRDLFEKKKTSAFRCRARLFEFLKFRSFAFYYLEFNPVFNDHAQCLQSQLFKIKKLVKFLRFASNKSKTVYL